MSTVVVQLEAGEQAMIASRRAVSRLAELVSFLDDFVERLAGGWDFCLLARLPFLVHWRCLARGLAFRALAVPFHDVGRPGVWTAGKSNDGTTPVIRNFG
jgi:hypothetical protein